jgi:neutral ceramidase
MLKAGVSKVDITPDEQIWLAGWGARTEPSQGISQRIYAKALALQDGRRKYAWLTADLLGYSKKMTDEVLRRCRAKFGLERDQLILNCTHNHSGPVTGDLLWLYFDLTKSHYDVIDRYTKRLLDRLVDAVGRALENLQPAKLSFGQGLAGFGVNRRRARDGGRVLPTVVDQDVPVLAVRTPRGELRAVVFGYACHTTCANDGTINGDYAGYAQAEIEAKFPGAIGLFVAGCGGDVNPLPRWAPGLERNYGHILAVAVEQALAGNMKPVDGPIRAAFDEVTIPFEKLPNEKELKAMLKAAPSELEKRMVRNQLEQLRDGDRRPREIRYPIHVWQMGGLKHIGLCSEPVSEFALRFKREYGSEDVWVSGYNDEFFSYIPTLRVWREGGYEGLTGMLECDLPGPYAQTVEELIAGKVDELWEATTDKPRGWPRPSKHL